MARPRLGITVHQVRLTLSLREGEDDDLIDFMQRLPYRGRAAAVKTALRTGNLNAALSADGPDDDELADALEDFLF